MSALFLFFSKNKSFELVVATQWLFLFSHPLVYSLRYASFPFLSQFHSFLLIFILILDFVTLLSLLFLLLICAPSLPPLFCTQLNTICLL